MTTLNINLRVTPRAAHGAIVALCLCLMSVVVSSEDVTLDTYYPAPSGIYVNMVTTQNTTLARDNGGVTVGSPSYAAPLTVNGNLNVAGTAAIAGDETVAGNATIANNEVVKNTLTVSGGSPQQGYVMTASDNKGAANWQSLSSVIKVTMGTASSGQTLPLPAGFKQAQCKWIVSQNSIIGGTKSGFVDNPYCGTTGLTVRCGCWTTPSGGNGDIWQPAVANFFMICEH